MPTPSPSEPLPIDERFLRTLEENFPGLRMIAKEESALQRWIGRLLWVITLGGQNAYLEDYTTVFGKTIYTPRSWSKRSPEERYFTLRHEAVHLEQFKRLGKFKMAFLYGIWILPMGLAWGRARLEWEAYAETLRAVAEIKGLEAAASLREHIVKQFVGPAYGWMWPFRRAVEKWFDEELERIRKTTKAS
ncbi:MAG: hypothetical protein NZM37_00240 [Sandaracinaceae bacterium]|nr:hypothetical protein [Sandaracinaceae bacterium]